MGDVTLGVTAWGRRLALAGIVGPSAFAFAVILGAWLEDGYLGGDTYLDRPDRRGGYSHVYNFVSELAAEASGVRSLMTAGFVTLGVCLLLFSASLKVRWPTFVALCVVVGGSGVSTLIAGTFSCDTGCPQVGARSADQQIHDVASIVTFVLWMVAAGISGWASRHRWYGRASLALGGVQLAAIGVLVALGSRGADDPVGLVQRIALIAAATWFVMTAVQLRRGVTVR